MNNSDTAITHDLRVVNERIRADAAAFIDSEEERCERRIQTAAQTIAADTHGCRIVWLCGPSSVGKTTVSSKLCAALEQSGVAAFTVSLDNFYRGAGKAPLAEDGTFDYESPRALDLDRLRRCLTDLAQTGETVLPHYDFLMGAPSEKTTYLHAQGDAVVIFEGVHAFSPLLTAGIETHIGDPLKLFVNTKSRFTDGSDLLLCRRDIRLSRRLLRDERTRASSFDNTMRMWQQVLRGGERYIFPYAKDADITIDTTMGYEPCVLSRPILLRLHTLYGTPFEEQAKRFEDVYARFEPLALSAVPDGSVLREFVGEA